MEILTECNVPARISGATPTSAIPISLEWNNQDGGTPVAETTTRE